MPLNEDLDVRRIPVAVRRAFLRRPEKMLLPPRVRLYKWTNLAFLAAPISPWWSFVDPIRLPSGVMTDGFEIMQERARRLGADHRELARSRAAISDQFGNAMAHVVAIELMVGVWALAGQASGQPEFAREQVDLQNVFLIGGAYQAWIPNLTMRQVQQIAVPGRVTP